MAFWVDHHLYAAVMGPSTLPIANPVQAGIMVWVQRFLYLVFPMIWLTGLGWVGVNAQTRSRQEWRGHQVTRRHGSVGR